MPDTTGRITLGLLIDQLVSGYARSIIDGVSRGSQDQDANLIVFSGRILGTPLGHEYQNNVVFDYIKPGTIDALVMATGTQGSYLPFEKLLAYLGRLKGIPLVSIGVRIDGVPSILTDNRTGIFEAVNHLVDIHGVHRIAFLKGPEINNEARERFVAYGDALHARGLDEDPGLWMQGDFNRAHARLAVLERLQRIGQPDFQALIAANDEMAIGAIEALRERGLAVPRDVSVIGFDNIPDSQFVVPSLTTVGQLLAEQGQSAARIAVGLARGEASPQDVMFPARLVMRTSCGCLPQSATALDSLPATPGRARPGETETIVDRCMSRSALRLSPQSFEAVRRHLRVLVENALADGALAAFQEFLNEEVAGEIDIAEWPALLTALQSELLSSARTSKDVARLQASFQKALTILSEMLRLQQGRALSELQIHLAQLRRVTERLAFAASPDELINDLANELQLLDIRTCFLACYPEVILHRRGDSWTVPSRAEAVLAWVDDKRILPGESERVFSPADRFVPSQFLPCNRRSTLIATATFFREGQIGYIAFEPGKRDYAIYENFCVQIGSLLSGSLLFNARQKAIEELKRERAFTAVLMDNVPDHIYFKDERSRFVLVNQAMAAFLGLADPADAIGKTDFDFYTLEHAQPAFDAEQKIMRSGTPIVDIEEKETWPDGHETWASTTKMPMRNASGSIIGSFGLSKDITEHRRAEEKIVQLAALVESSQDAIFGVDLEDRITSWNRGAQDAYGYSADEIVGKPVSVLMTDEAWKATLPAWGKAKRGEAIRNVESAGKKKGGATVPVSYAIAPMRGHDGQIVGIAVVAQDVTEERAIQARLIQAQRLESLATLAAGIAHQFNNINTVIEGYLEILIGSPEISATIRSYGQEALKGVERLVHITAQLQGLTSASKPGEDTCQLDKLIESLMRDFNERFEKMKVTVVLELKETPRVRMNLSRVCFILTALVNNSLDALLGRAGPSLTLRTGSVQSFAFVEVEDTGCGIPQHDIPRLFSPFFTTKGEWATPGSPQAEVRGEGLSLSVCRSTVMEYGGRIDVNSEPGVGTKFRIWLPT